MKVTLWVCVECFDIFERKEEPSFYRSKIEELVLSLCARHADNPDCKKKLEGINVQQRPKEVQ